MTYSQQVQNMCPITKGPKHGPAPIPEEGAWVKAYEIKDISGYTHVGHAGAADGLHQSLFDDAVLDVQRQLAGALLRCTPAHTVSQTGNILNFFCLHPFCLFGNGSTTMMYALCNGTHFFNFF